MEHREQILLLEKIADTGDCEHVRHFECKSCPLSRWKKKPDGTHKSCLEATNALQHPDGYKKAYSEAAREILTDLAIEEMLGE